MNHPLKVWNRPIGEIAPKRQPAYKLRRSHQLRVIPTIKINIQKPLDLL